MWLVQSANALMGYQLNYFGIFPRHIDNMAGILVWPFLHLGPEHLMLNTMPLLVLGFFVALRGPVKFLQASAFIVVIGGGLIWLLGRPAFHIGSSGLVFGFLGFLIAEGLYERSLSSIFIALVVVTLYGGLFADLVPLDKYISWEAHLFGLIGGIIAAWVLRRPRRPVANEGVRHNICSTNRYHSL